MPDNQALIYCIKNTVSGHSYVGSTVAPLNRINAHKLLLKKGTHTSFVLQRAWDKHGEDKFVFEPLLVCNVKDRFFYESTAIKFAQYNVFKGAGHPPAGSFLGLKHSETGRKNLSVGAAKRWERDKQLYAQLCGKAWALVQNGMNRTFAAKTVGVSHSTFWRWIKQNGLNVVDESKRAWSKK
jgi:group I intron endonuclease